MSKQGEEAASEADRIRALEAIAHAGPLTVSEFVILIDAMRVYHEHPELRAKEGHVHYVTGGEAFLERIGTAAMTVADLGFSGSAPVALPADVRPVRVPS